MNAPLWITEQEVRETVSLNDAIAALEEGLKQEAAGTAKNVDKALATWDPSSSMHALGSAMTEHGYAAFKTWVNTPEGAAAVLSLFDARGGSLLAMMEAVTLGTMRTSGISGVATHLLARKDADEMALIGTGRQALMQVAAIAATRRLRQLRFFSPSADSRAAFMKKCEGMFSFDIVECGSVEEAVKDVPIVTLITRAREPFLHADMIAAGTHINAAGAILPGHAEFADDLWPRISRAVVDSRSNARKASMEFAVHFGTDDTAWMHIPTLGQLLLDQAQRREDEDITVFKPMGMGLSDLCVAIMAYERCKGRELGTALPAGNRALPEWTPAF